MSARSVCANCSQPIVEVPEESIWIHVDNYAERCAIAFYATPGTERRA